MAALSRRGAVQLRACICSEPDGFIEGIHAQLSCLTSRMQGLSGNCLQDYDDGGEKWASEQEARKELAHFRGANEDSCSFLGSKHGAPNSGIYTRFPCLGGLRSTCMGPIGTRGIVFTWQVRVPDQEPIKKAHDLDCRQLAGALSSFPASAGQRGRTARSHAGTCASTRSSLGCSWGLFPNEVPGRPALLVAGSEFSAIPDRSFILGMAAVRKGGRVFVPPKWPLRLEGENQQIQTGAEHGLLIRVVLISIGT